MEVTRYEAAVRERAGDRCELCGAREDLTVTLVQPSPEPALDRCVLLCETCGGDGGAEPSHWFCLQSAAWSEVPAVQVTSWRILQSLPDASWAQDLLGQLYLDEPTLAWAKAGDTSDDAPTLDSNGARLVDGDAVTLIKDLDVKGAGFTAKRGTLVKNIRLTGDPAHVDARVNKVAIVLRTEFLKKA